MLMILKQKAKKLNVILKKNFGFICIALLHLSLTYLFDIKFPKTIFLGIALLSLFFIWIVFKDD